jgi:hypothetical protein
VCTSGEEVVTRSTLCLSISLYSAWPRGESINVIRVARSSDELIELIWMGDDDPPL